jgi:hypothetical protein
LRQWHMRQTERNTAALAVERMHHFTKEYIFMISTKTVQLSCKPSWDHLLLFNQPRSNDNINFCPDE